MLNMFDMSNKDRLKRIKKAVKTDYTNRHDSAMMNLFPTDLEWLVVQAMKTEIYGAALHEIKETTQDEEIHAIAYVALNDDFE